MIWTKVVPVFVFHARASASPFDNFLVLQNFSTSVILLTYKQDWDNTSNPFIEAELINKEEKCYHYIGLILTILKSGWAIGEVYRRCTV